MKPATLIKCFINHFQFPSVKIIYLLFLLQGLNFSEAKSQNTVVVNSDINFEPIPSVSLDDYRSVQLRDQSKQNPKLAFGVAISGGGCRAQYFGLGVLLGLEQIKDPNPDSQRNLLDEIDYFSTVSGGSLAAGYYLTIKKNVLLKNEFKSFNEFWLSNRHVNDLQEYIWQSAEIKDFIANFGRYERNGHIESMPDVIDRQLLQYDTSDLRKLKIRMRLSDFFIPNGSPITPTLPIFVANGTIFTSVERLPFMPHILKALNVNCSMMPIDISFKENPSYSFPLTYAVSGSAAFPGILPQVKLGLTSKDTGKVIRVVDGGVVDNLGYKTLIELLASDHSVKNVNKRAVIIDCSAIGEGSRYGNPGTESRINVLKAALLFTVDSKYVTRNADIQNYLTANDLNKANYCLLGFSDIKNTLKVPEAVTDNEFINLRDSLRQEVGQSESADDSDDRWLRLFQKFQKSVIKHCGLKAPVGVEIDDNTWDDNKLRTIDFISFKDFENFKLVDKLMLYELASQIETKMKIYKSEKIILILAGKYVAYLRRDNLRQLYTVSTK